MHTSETEMDRIATYKHPDGEVLEWSFWSSNGWTKDQAFEQFKTSIKQIPSYMPNQDGSIDWDTPVYPTKKEINSRYKMENFAVRCFLCWGKI